MADLPGTFALMTEVQVRSKIPGGDGPPDVRVDVTGLTTTAAELIRLAVEEQVRLLRGDGARCRQMLDRQYLSMEEIREQAATGAVRMPAVVPETAPGVAEEIARAHRAFERNVFAVFADGRQLRSLSEEIALPPAHRSRSCVSLPWPEAERR